jgi:hypothetical protein
MKTTVKQIATGTLMVLLSLAINVQAHGNKHASRHENNFEPALQIENWMIDESTWNLSPSEEIAVQTEQDAELKVEDWMTDTYAWDAAALIDEATELPLQVEDWMTDTKTWDNLKVTTETETALVIEDWMVSSYNWDR